MGWEDLLQKTGETITAPWVGGRSLRLSHRVWTIQDRLPREHGWYEWRPSGRRVVLVGRHDPDPDILGHRVRGYLVGDRIVPDGARVDPDPLRAAASAEVVHLIEPGLDRFVRIEAGRACEAGPLFYAGQDMPQGPEEEVLQAYLDQAPGLDAIKGVPPALDAAFRLESWQRAEAQRIREEIERQRREEEERRQREERRRQLVERLGDGEGRRAMAAQDFAEAARAALAVGGAEYLDHRPAHGRNEMIVRFRLDRMRYECTCDNRTMQIIDAGICLTDHDTGVRGDTRFTLESLPSVIREAIGLHELVVFRHA